MLDVAGARLTTQDAAVVVLFAGADLPQSLVGTAQHLGGPSWRVPVSADGDALSLAHELSQLPEIASAFPDVVLPRQASAVDFDDPVYPDQWYLETIGAQAFFERSLGTPEVRVAVIDSAVDIGHADLEGAAMAPYDAFDDDDDPSPNPGEYCQSGNGICDDHGTAVAGIILARGNNATDMVGICPECTLIPIKMLGEGNGTLSRDIAAFEHAIAQDAAVINNSWGYTESIPVPEPLAMVIKRAATETRGGLGSLVVFAAGNDDREIVDDELQALDFVLCVSASDLYGFPTNYTNFGNTVDLAAPSATLTLKAGGGTFGTFGGTSAAAPVVSGVAGWILSEYPELSAEELRMLFIESARPSSQVTHDAETGHHPIYGYGELKSEELLAALDPQAPQDTGSVEGGGGCGGCGGGIPPSSLGLLGLLLLRRRRS